MVLVLTVFSANAMRELADETVKCFHHSITRVITNHFGGDQNSLKLLLIGPLCMVSHVGVKISAGERGHKMKTCHKSIMWCEGFDCKPARWFFLRDVHNASRRKERNVWGNHCHHLLNENHRPHPPLYYVCCEVFRDSSRQLIPEPLQENAVLQHQNTESDHCCNSNVEKLKNAIVLILFVCLFYLWLIATLHYFICFFLQTPEVGKAQSVGRKEIVNDWRAGQPVGCERQRFFFGSVAVITGQRQI